MITHGENDRSGGYKMNTTCPYCNGKGYNYVERGSSLTYPCEDCNTTGITYFCSRCCKSITEQEETNCAGMCWNDYISSRIFTLSDLETLWIQDEEILWDMIEEITGKSIDSVDSVKFRIMNPKNLQEFGLTSEYEIILA